MRSILIAFVAFVGLSVGSLGTAAAFDGGAPYDGDNNPSSEHPADCSGGQAVAREHGADLPSAAQCPE